MTNYKHAEKERYKDVFDLKAFYFKKQKHQLKKIKKQRIMHSIDTKFQSMLDSRDKLFDNTCAQISPF